MMVAYTKVITLEVKSCVFTPNLMKGEKEKFVMTECMLMTKKNGSSKIAFILLSRLIPQIMKDSRKIDITKIQIDYHDRVDHILYLIF